MSKTFVKA